MSTIDWASYHHSMATLRAAALNYAALSTRPEYIESDAGPWHRLLEAAMDYTGARRALLDAITHNGAHAPNPTTDTPLPGLGVSRTHCIK